MKVSHFNLIEDEKGLDICIEEDKSGLTEKVKECRGERREEKKSWLATSMHVTENSVPNSPITCTRNERRT